MSLTYCIGRCGLFQRKNKLQMVMKSVFFVSVQFLHFLYFSYIDMELTEKLFNLIIIESAFQIKVVFPPSLDI